MLILKKDLKHGIISLKINSSDDLWYSSHFISPNDSITMRTERKIKIGSGDDRNIKVVRKMITLTLLVETVSYNPSLHQLRVKGTITKGPEDVSLGSYHTFGISVDDSFTLVKKSWPSYLLDKLNEAAKSSADILLFVVFDREEALFSTLRQTGIEHIASVKADVAKKTMDSTVGKSLYDLIIGKIQDYEKQLNPSNIVCASPAFWKQYLEKRMPDELKKKTIFATCSGVHRRVIGELLASPQLKSILDNQRTSKEMNFVNLCLSKLQNEMLVYGFDDVQESSDLGAVSKVGVTDQFIEKTREEGSDDKLNSLLNNIDKSKGKVHLLSSDMASDTVNGLGGIVGVLRWKQ